MESENEKEIYIKYHGSSDAIKSDKMDLTYKTENINNKCINNECMNFDTAIV